LSPLSAAGLEFVAARHLATLTTLRAGGSPHVTPVGFTWDDDAGLARVICSGSSAKARHVSRHGRVALCQVDGRQWLTLEGNARVSADPGEVAEAVVRYAARYRTPRKNPSRVALVVTVVNVLGSAPLRS
jgi:F420H(2)-dependent biliverdin reductase